MHCISFHHNSPTDTSSEHRAQTGRKGTHRSRSLCHEHACTRTHRTIALTQPHPQPHHGLDRPSVSGHQLHRPHAVCSQTAHIHRPTSTSIPAHHMAELPPPCRPCSPRQRCRHADLNHLHGFIDAHRTAEHTHTDGSPRRAGVPAVAAAAEHAGGEGGVCAAHAPRRRRL